MFLEHFSNKDDVINGFYVKEEECGDIKFAIYDSAYYEGFAFVLFEKDGVLYEVNGSHCSCYGLEGQWNPEETSVKDLMFRVDKGHLGWGYGSGFSKELKEVLSSL